MANNNGTDNSITDINKEALINNSELGTENNTNTPQQTFAGTAAPNNPDGTTESHDSSVAGETTQEVDQKLTISIDKIEEIKNDIRDSVEKGIPSDEQEKDILNNKFENLASAMETFSDSLNTEKGKEEFENSKEYSEEAGLIIQDIKDNDGTKDDAIKEKILNLLDKTIPQTIDKVLSVDKEAMLNSPNDVDETNNDEKGNLNHIDLSQFEKNSDLFKDAFKDVAADNKQEVFDKLCDIYQNSYPDINTNDATMITHAICKIYEEDKLEKINAARTSIHAEKDSLLGITKGYRYESKKEIGNFEKSLDRVSGEIDNLGKNLTSDASIAKYQELKEDFASIRTGLEKGLENIKAVRSDQKIKEFRRDIYESLDSIDKKIDEIKENEFVVIGNDIDVHIEEVDTDYKNIEKEDKPEIVYKDPEKTGDAKVDRFNAVLSRYEFAAGIGKWNTKGKDNTSADNEQKGLENSQQSSSTISRKENHPFYTWNTLVRDIYAHSRGILIDGAPVTTERIISDIENIIQSQGIPGTIIIGIIGGICVLIERLIHGAEKDEADHVEKNEEIQDFIKELYDKIEQKYSESDDIDATTEQNQVDQNEENDQPNDTSNDEKQKDDVDKNEKEDQPQDTEKSEKDTKQVDKEESDVEKKTQDTTNTDEKENKVDNDEKSENKKESKDTDKSEEDTKENSIESKEEEKQENQKDQADKSEENSDTDSKVDQDEKDIDPIDNQELEEENNQNIEADETEEKIEADSNNTENKEETVVEIEESEQESVDQEDSDKEESVEQEQNDTEIQDENKDIEESEEEADQTETNEEETESVEATEVDDQDEPEDSATEGKIEQEKPEEDTSNEDDAVAAMDDNDDEEQKKKDSGAVENSSSDSQEGEDTQDESDSNSADVDGHSEENNPEEEVDAKEAATGDDKSERDEQTGITKDEEKENVESSENNAEQNDTIDNLSEGMQDASLDAINEEAANKIEEGSTDNEGNIETTTVDPTEEYKTDIPEEQGISFVDSVLSNLETNGGDINDIIVDEILDRGGEPIDFSDDMNQLIHQGYDIDVDYISDAVYDASTEFAEPNVSFVFGDDEIYVVGNSDSGVTPQNTSVEAYDNDINDTDTEGLINIVVDDFATYSGDTIEAVLVDTTLPDFEYAELNVDNDSDKLELNQLEKANASDNLENAADNASKDSDPSDNESNNRVDMIEPSQYQNDDTSGSDIEIDYDSIFRE